MESRSVSMQHATTIGEDLYHRHLTNRSRWTDADGSGDQT